MTKPFVFVLLFLLTAIDIKANFGGYVSNYIDDSGTIMLTEAKASIALKKEKLLFDLGQRVGFQGNFWLENRTDKPVTITIAFPQRTHWRAEWDDINETYVAKKLYKLTPRLTIDDIKTAFETEKYSDIPKDYTEVKLLNRSQAVKMVAKAAAGNETDPVVSILVWFTKKLSFAPKENRKVTISYHLPWFYKDAWWSFGIRSRNKRHFSYITQTANTWLDRRIEDFEAVVKFPEDARNNITLFPSGWVSNHKHSASFKKKNWSPGKAEEIRFSWKSNLAMHSKLPDTDCVEDKYYQAYHWRFGFDGSVKTAWCGSKKMLNCPVFSMVPFDKDGRYDPKKIPSRKNEFKSPIRIKGIEVVNGYGKNKKTFINNARVKTIDLYTDIWENYKHPIVWKQQFELKDSMQSQKLMFDRPVNIEGGLNFKIKELYPGKTYDDICISEISVIKR